MISIVLSGLLTGGALGFVLQRGRFCITGGFRDMYLNKDFKIFKALLIAILVQAVGIYLMYQFGIIQELPGSLTGGFAMIAIVVGSFLFGVGAILGGGCATGMWYRSGEGLISAWVALFMFALMATITRAGALSSVNDWFSAQVVGSNSISQTFSVSVWVLIFILFIAVLVAIYTEMKKPKVKIIALKSKKRGIKHLLFEKRWHPFVTALLIGLIAIVAWPLSIATGRNFGLGITVPSSNILQYLSTGDDSFLNWGIFLVVGVLLGSYVAAKASGEFKLRVPEAKMLVKNALGGILMGFGATIASG